MPDDRPLLDQLEPTVRAFVQRHRIPAESVRPGGRVVVTVGARHRVTIGGGSHNRLVLLADLLPLPDNASESQVDLILLRLARYAAGMLKTHPSTLCTDRKRQMLLLQQVIPPVVDLAVLEASLGQFAGALEFWKSVCRGDAAALAGVPA